MATAVVKEEIKEEIIYALKWQQTQHAKMVKRVLDGPCAQSQLHVHSPLTESVPISGSHTPTCSVTKDRLTSLPVAATPSLNLDLVCNYSLIDIH